MATYVTQGTNITLADKQIAFRVDASLETGAGHVMRCLTLADSLSKLGAKCWFICRAHPGHLADLISTRGHQCYLLDAIPDPDKKATIEPQLTHASWLGCDWTLDAIQTQAILAKQRPEWLVVDHYALDTNWENKLRPYVEHIMVIDDLADRLHDCDLLLDQNLGRQPNDYQGRVPLNCTLLIGPSYALLRPEFAALREYSLGRRQVPELKQVLITMGGVDRFNVTSRVLAALRYSPLPDDCRILVVMGAKAPWLTKVESLTATLPWPTEVLINTNNMAQLMASSDLAIGAAGSTSWERCCLGLPTLMMIIADNQREVASYLMSAGAAVCIESDKIEKELPEWIWSYVSEPNTYVSMIRQASSITDGLGVWHVSNRMASISMERST